MEPVQNRDGNEPPFTGVRPFSLWGWRRNPMDALMNTNAVIPAHGFPEHSPEMTLVPDDHFIENLMSESSYQSLLTIR